MMQPMISTYPPPRLRSEDLFGDGLGRGVAHGVRDLPPEAALAPVRVAEVVEPVGAAPEMEGREGEIGGR
jgi:hypothetical protein